MSIVEPSPDTAAPPVPEALKRFIWDIQSIVELTESEREILMVGGDIMGRFLICNEPLPAPFARVDASRRQDFQLYADGLERFSILATVLAGGQALPPVLNPGWEIMGVLRGAVTLGRYQPGDAGDLLARGNPAVMRHGQYRAFGSQAREALSLANALSDEVAIIVHVHGAEMAKAPRTIYPEKSEPVAAVMGFANSADAPPYDIFTIQTRIDD